MNTVFIRAIEADVDDKANVLREAIQAATDAAGTTRFEVDPTKFRLVPKSPFAYWVDDQVRSAFGVLPAFQSNERFASFGLSTKNDFRYLRLLWEVAAEGIPTSRSDTINAPWVRLAKGGRFARFYANLHLVANWQNDGREMKTDISEYRGSRGWGYQWSAALNGHSYYCRPGLTWPRRTNGLSFRVMPAGCIFGDKGPAIFVERDDPTALLALNAVLNSRAFGALVALQLARTELAQSYEVGLIQRTPVPDLSPADEAALATLARRAWCLKRNLDTVNETSHAFTLPALMQVEGATLSERAKAWRTHVDEVEAELADLQAQIDDRCFTLYDIDLAERARIEHGFGSADDDADKDQDDDPTEDEEINVGPVATSLLSWGLGVSFGRFDVRGATRARALPTEPEPFDPLPVCSPGMFTGEDGLPLATAPESYPIAFPTDGVLVDDPGHPQDLMSHVRAVFEVVFGEDASERLHEAENLVCRRNEDLRAWFAKRFFAAHVRRYSKSRRKAPIYWQLGTPSGSYSVWCYYHRLSGDTLFRLAQDYVAPKVAHEEGKLNILRQEAGADPSSKQRKAIGAQDSFVTELRAFKDEVERVAPLWNPNLNDGVIINFAPLWRLVPHNKPWQKECKKVWDKLQQGDYDWSHLATHLWPERVVPKCTEDRSLSIAHGLEAELWFEDDDGKWQPRQVGSERLGELVAQDSSSAVKAALGALLSAPVQDGGAKRRGRKRGGA